MKYSRQLGLWALVGLFLLTACGGAGSPQRTESDGKPAQPTGKTLVVATRAEPPGLTAKAFRQLGLTTDLSARIFNAGLTTRDDQGVPTAYLAQSVPQLGTDDWRVSGDGTMETTYHLRPNITWHDGQPLTADDFVFAFEVFNTPALGVSTTNPINLMDQVIASDPNTVVIKWKQTFPEGNALQAGTGGTSNDAFPPLPRHILSQPFQTQDPEAFIANPFWVSQYIGAGPYRLDRWETGAFFEASAFEGHILGKPKIARIREMFITDPSTVTANLLAGEVQMTTGDSIRFTDGQTLRAQWADKGRILNFPNLYRIIQFQRRPEFASTRAFTDLRVRQALHTGVDFSALNEALQDGQTTAAVGPIPPTTSYYKQLDQAVAHYDYDPRRTDQLMTDAGFAKGSDGIWASPDPQFGRMSFELNVLASPDSNNEMAIIANTWRKLGFDIKEVSWTPALGSDNEYRNSFPGLSTTSTPPGESALVDYRSDRIPTAENRWRGTNRGAWPGSPAYNRLVDTWETSLDVNERTQAVIQMNKMLNEDAVVIHLYWKLNAQAVANGLTGPRITDPNSGAEWNIQEWELS